MDKNFFFKPLKPPVILSNPKQLNVFSLVADTKTLITFFRNGELNTLSLGETDPGLVTFTDNEDVRKTSSESVITSILKVDDIETTEVTFTMSDDTNTTHVVTTSNESNVTNVELKEGIDLSSFKVDLNGIVRADQRIGVTNGTTVVSNNERNTLSSQLHLLDLAELVASFFIRNTVDSEATLNIVEDTEVFTSLFDRNNVHETGGEVGVSADLVVNFDGALHDNASDFAFVQSILQTVTDQNDQRQAFTELVGTRRRTRSLKTIRK